jgi:tetratricopeptide (TPR) repeat protein
MWGAETLSLKFSSASTFLSTGFLWLITASCLAAVPMAPPNNLTSGPQNEPDLQIAKANQYIARRSFVEAQAIINSLLTRFPGEFHVRLAQARLLKSMGLTARSKAAYEKLKLSDPQAPEPLIALSEMAFESLNARLALDLARKAEAVAPASLSAQLSLASALIATSHYQEAADRLESLSKRNVGNGEVQYLLYKMAIKRDRYSQARTALENSIKLAPSEPRRILELSELCQYMRDYEGAKHNLQRVLSADPASIDALIKLAVLYEFNFHDYKEAIAQYQKVLNIDSNSVTAMAGIDRCRLKENDLAGLAKDAFQRFVRHTVVFDTLDTVTPTVSDGRDNFQF